MSQERVELSTLALKGRYSTTELLARSQKKTFENKAKYKLVSTISEKDSIGELFEISTNQLIWHKSFRNNKPFGEWYSLDKNNSKTINIIYGRIKPQGYYTYDLINQKLTVNIEGEFTKPALIGVDTKILDEAKRYNVSDLSVWIAMNVGYCTRREDRRCDMPIA